METKANEGKQTYWQAKAVTGVFGHEGGTYYSMQMYPQNPFAPKYYDDDYEYGTCGLSQRSENEFEANPFYEKDFTRQQTRASYTSTLIKQFVNALSRHIIEQECKKGTTVEICNLMGAHHTMTPDQRMHILRFGEMFLREVWRDGYKEPYKVTKHITAGKDLRGFQALYYIVCHETAHAIQVEAGQRRKYEVHNEYFIETYERLLREYPYEDMLNQFVKGIDLMILGIKK